MNVAYGVYWYEGKGKNRKSVCHLDTLSIDGDWDLDETHIRIRQEIWKKHPNTHLHGYSQIKDDNDKL